MSRDGQGSVARHSQRPRFSLRVTKASKAFPIHTPVASLPRGWVVPEVPIRFVPIALAHGEGGGPRHAWDKDGRAHRFDLSIL